MANCLAMKGSTALRYSLGLSQPGLSPTYTIPRPTIACLSEPSMDIYRATRCDPKNDVRNGKTPPARRNAYAAVG
jgi:hypothetical protein